MSSPEEVGGGVKSAHDVVMDIVRRPVHLRDVAAQSYLGGHTFERFQLGDFVLQLLHETSEFRDRAASYRNFGVAAGAWCKGVDQKYGRVLGYNVKVDDTDLVNIHAEDLVTTKAKDANFDQISVLAVIGPTQEDHASSKHTETLHPCGRCRGRLADSPLVRPDTLFVAARPDFTVIQFASLAAIQAVHDDGDDSGITTFRFPETPAILAPRSMPDDWTASRPMMRVEEIDSADYDETVGLYLLQRQGVLGLEVE